jgi:membrane protease YdiL (CAAX protease family)
MLAAALVVVFSLSIWILAVALRRRIINFQPRRPVPWRALDVYAVVVIYFACQLAAGFAVHWLSPAPPQAEAAPDGDAEMFSHFVLASALASLVVLALSLIWLTIVAGASAADVGLARPRLAYDLKLGLCALVAILPVLYAIQFLLTQLMPSEHPVARLLEEHPQVHIFLLCGFSAVLVAPLVEEFLFRGVLQGWMERVEANLRVALMVEPAEQPPDIAAESLDTANAPPSTVDINPYRAPRADGTMWKPIPAIPPADQSRFGQAVASVLRFFPIGMLPILIGALAFALVHLSHGPDPIPLFVLALVLGYLYQRTHRLWPCILVHAGLNACSVLMLWWHVRGG